MIIFHTLNNLENYWDPSTINQSRPKFWREFEIYAGPNFDKFLARI